MSNPFKTNTTCDIYFDIGTPVLGPTNVPCTLVPAWEEGQAHGTRATPTLMYTHKLHLEPDVDIRDWYAGAMATSVPAANEPAVYIPNSATGTPFVISFVERVNKGQRADHKIAYLNRTLPTWPTNNL
jgi:hypothetical protein